jgi:hypothetical protein
VAHERQRLRGDHLDAGGGERKGDAEHPREESRLRTRRDDHRVGAERALRGLDRRDATAAHREPRHRRVLEDSPAVILQRPGIRLHRPLRVGVPPEVKIGPADGIVADDGHQLLEVLAIEELPLEAACLAYLGPAPRQRELRLAQRHADPVRLVLGRVSEQVVHLRPEPLLFEAEGTVDVSGAPTIAPGGFPPHDILLEDENVDA